MHTPAFHAFFILGSGGAFIQLAFCPEGRQSFGEKPATGLLPAPWPFCGSGSFTLEKITGPTGSRIQRLRGMDGKELGPFAVSGMAAVVRRLCAEIGIAHCCC